MSQIILLKRTNKLASHDDVKNIIPNFGEAVYLASDKQLVIGKDASTSISSLERIQLVPAAQASKGVFFTANPTTDTVNTVDKDGTSVAIRTSASNVSDSTSSSTVQTTLDNINTVISNHVASGATSSNAHGNITRDGKIGSNANYAVVTTTGGALTSKSLATTDPTASGNSSTFIDSISLASDGKITVTKKNLPNMATSDPTASGTATAFIDTISLSATGKITVTKKNLPSYAAASHTHSYAASASAGGPASTTVSSADSSSTTVYVTGVSAANGALKYNTNIYMNCSTGVLMGAAWNDFAECRDCQEEPGTCVVEVGNGKLVKSDNYCQLGCSIISDTYGMLIGVKEEVEYSPIAVAGRVLAKFDYSKGDPQPGFPVCSAPNGRVALMDRNQVRNWPDAIVGYVSEIPTYEEWNGRKVDGRIWIKVK